MVKSGIGCCTVCQICHLWRQQDLDIWIVFSMICIFTFRKVGSWHLNSDALYGIFSKLISCKCRCQNKIDHCTQQFKVSKLIVWLFFSQKPNMTSMNQAMIAYTPRVLSSLGLDDLKLLLGKGQIISECLHEIIVYPKIATKIFLGFLSWKFTTSRLVQNRVYLLANRT